MNGFRPKRIVQIAHNMQYCTVPSAGKNDDTQYTVCSVKPHTCTCSAAELPELSAEPENITAHKEITDMKNIMLTVEGMSCGHCSARVEKALNAIEGVSAQVDLEAKTAAVTYPDTVTVDALKAAVTDAGYSVTGSR